MGSYIGIRRFHNDRYRIIFTNCVECQKAQLNSVFFLSVFFLASRLRISAFAESYYPPDFFWLGFVAFLFISAIKALSEGSTSSSSAGFSSLCCYYGYCCSASSSFSSSLPLFFFFFFFFFSMSPAFDSSSVFFSDGFSSVFVPS